MTQDKSTQRWKLVPVEPTEEMMDAAFQEHRHAGRDIWRTMVTAAPSPPAQDGTIKVNAVALRDAMADSDGFWMSCSGCHESNEGVPTGDWDAVLECNIGIGCSECGGIGAVWDTTDYEAMAKELSAPPAHDEAVVERVGNAISDALGEACSISHRPDRDMVARAALSAIPSVNSHDAMKECVEEMKDMPEALLTAAAFMADQGIRATAENLAAYAVKARDALLKLEGRQ